MNDDTKVKTDDRSRLARKLALGIITQAEHDLLVTQLDEVYPPEATRDPLAGLRAKDRARAIATARKWLAAYHQLDLLDPADLARHIGYGRFHVEQLIDHLEARS